MNRVDFYGIPDAQLFYLAKIVTHFDIKNLKREDVDFEVTPDKMTQYLYDLEQTPWKVSMKVPIKKGDQKLPYFYEVTLCVDGQVFYMNDGVQLRIAWPMKILQMLDRWKFPLVKLG